VVTVVTILSRPGLITSRLIDYCSVYYGLSAVLSAKQANDSRNCAVLFVRSCLTRVPRGAAANSGLRCLGLGQARPGRCTDTHSCGAVTAHLHSIVLATLSAPCLKVERQSLQEHRISKKMKLRFASSFLLHRCAEHCPPYSQKFHLNLPTRLQQILLIYAVTQFGTSPLDLRFSV
jgi:hypothetical protein